MDRLRPDLPHTFGHLSLQRHFYTLRGVSEYHYYGLLNASSPGWYFNAYLKGHY